MTTITNIFIFFIAAFFYSISSSAQIYDGTTYQAVIRNSSNALVANTVVGVKISILQNTAAGTVVFSERHTPTTNANGLATFVIGQGTALLNSYFGINWLTGPYFIKTETDPTGGTNYTISGTSQINAVPYALWTENAYFATNSGDSWKRTGNIVNASTDFIGSTNDVDVVFKRSNSKSGRLGLTNTAFGNSALPNNTSVSNSGFGSFSLQQNSAGYGNVAIGYESLRVNNGNLNTAVGAGSQVANTGGGNTSVGNASLPIATGDQNTAVGYRSLDLLTTGTGNIGIGKIVNVPLPTANDQLSIGNVIYGTNMGNTAAGTIGIGVATPTEKLEVAGKTKTTNLQVTAGAGYSKVLTSDGSGNATWQLPSNVNTGINISKSTSQTIPSSIDTKIDFNNENTDDANAFNPSTDEWTIPSDGFYHIYATARFNPFPANQNVEIVIYINGILRNYNTRSVSGAANFDISADLKLFTNDKVSIYVYQTTGADAIIPAAGNSSIYFSGYKIY